MQAFSLWKRPGGTGAKGVLLAACDTESRAVQSGVPLSGDCTPAPPVSSSSRKFLESGNSYLTQEVIAQLLGDGRGSLRASGDLRRPFIDKLPLGFYIVQRTPSAKQSESSTLQRPTSLLHGSHTCSHTSKKEGWEKRSETRPARLDLFTLQLWNTPGFGLLCWSYEALWERLGGGERSLKRFSLPAEWSPSLPNQNGNECLHVKSTKAISWRQLYLDWEIDGIPGGVEKRLK